MGIFNFFIVIPEIIASLFFGRIIRMVFGTDSGNAPLYVVMAGGVFMLLAAACVGFVDDVGERKVAAVMASHEPFIEPVPEVR